MTQRQRWNRDQGLTLIEVLIAIAILAVGIMAMAQFQAASLRNTAAAESINRTTRLVRGELEWQRQTALEPATLECSSLVPADFESCEVLVEPCSLAFAEDGSSTFECGDGISPSSYRVTVTANGPRGQHLTLDTLWTGIFISGTAGQVPE